ncbi:hypothetical protein BSL78_28187 [Apostichopus japonicus]|uniref:Methyltransferase domain-containing protein n=1 Tax=Stichopus japonicus TaxID=307972 RepID=A0A2G8JGZ8_STIJA|nr:hypothetical protein BSL78_28187 [Apostichopus japonicus]
MLGRRIYYSCCKQQFDNASFQYHKVVVKILNDLIQNKDARILDIAAGTGKLGLLLRERGFTDIDGIDGSKSMSNLAKEKNIYKNYFHHMIGRERIPQIADATYDAASCGGSGSKGHLTFDNIQTMLRTVKPGGYLVFSCAVWNYQFEDFSRERLDLCLQDLKKLGLCSSSEKTTSMHREKEPADIFILQRGDARLL